MVSSPEPRAVVTLASALWSLCTYLYVPPKLSHNAILVDFQFTADEGKALPDTLARQYVWGLSYQIKAFSTCLDIVNAINPLFTHVEAYCSLCKDDLGNPSILVSVEVLMHNVLQPLGDTHHM